MGLADFLEGQKEPVNRQLGGCISIASRLGDNYDLAVRRIQTHT
jgi:hypothetical protein